MDSMLAEKKELLNEGAGFSYLAEKLALCFSESDISRIHEAFNFANEKHLGQFRKSGEPYITHPIEVAEYCIDWRLDAQAVMAALLHDVMEDQGVPKEELAERFGVPVANLVDGLSKLEKIEFQTHLEAQGENFRKMLLAMASDVRVILVKLADRLHNMRTIDSLRLDKRQRIARETMDVYVPIAHRLGINGLYRELQELSFSKIYPFRYSTLKNALKTTRGSRTETLSPAKKEVIKALRDAGIKAELHDREKTLFSIYRKMRRQNLSFSQVMDVYGFSVVVDNLTECYQALGVLHSLYKPLPGKVQDFIAMPKMNKYQSLHTTVVGPLKMPLEFLIRTRDMDHVAEYGVVAYWKYRNNDSENRVSVQEHSITWLQSLLDIQSQTDDSVEFLENVKFDLFPDSVYVFTPKGNIVSLPRAATALDFAYSIHSDVGDQAIAVKINNEAASLRTELQNGDIVEVITSPASRPNPAWLNFVRTGKARSNIRSYLRTATYAESAELGKHLLAQALTSLNLPDELSPAVAMRIIAESGVKTLDDVYVDIGTGKRLATMVAHRVMSLVRSANKGKAKQDLIEEVGAIKPGPILIHGSEGLSVQCSKCCYPIPGDDVIGQLNFEKGLVLHVSSCEEARRASRREPEKWIPVAWAEKLTGRFDCCISVNAQDEKGLLARIASEITDNDANIASVSMEEGKGDTFTKLVFLVQIQDKEHLNHLIRRLRHVQGVTKVARGK